jgi:hypothetical protein
MKMKFQDKAQKERLYDQILIVLFQITDIEALEKILDMDKRFVEDEDKEPNP